MVLDKVKDTADLLVRTFAAEPGHDVLKCFFTRMFPKDEMSLSAYHIRGEIFIA